MSDTPDPAHASVSIAIQIKPFLMKSGVAFTGDVQSLAEQMTRYVAENLSKRFTEEHDDAGLFVATAVTQGDETGSYEYREGHYVKDQPTPDDAKTGSSAAQ